MTLRTPIKGLTTQTLQFVILRSPLKDLDHQLCCLMMATTSTVPDLKFHQRILPVEDFERALGTKTLDLQLEAQDALFSL